MTVDNNNTSYSNRSSGKYICYFSYTELILVAYHIDLHLLDMVM